MAAFEGAQTSIFWTPLWISIEMIPVIVWVFPVPGYISDDIVAKVKSYWTLYEEELIRVHVGDLL